MRKKTAKHLTILLTASEYAIRHKLTRAGVNYLIKSNKVHAVSIGSMYLVQDTLRIKN